MSMALVAAASRRAIANARARRRMTRQDRKPCSGCGLCSKMSSQSAAVAGPMRAASLRMRPMVQSAMALDIDVIIEANPAHAPFGEDIRLDRQRLERRPVEFFE